MHSQGGSTDRIPGLTLLSHSASWRVGSRALLPALSSGREEQLSRLAPAFVAPGGGEPLSLGDPHLSRSPLRLAPGPEPGSILLSRNGSPIEVEADGHAIDAETVFSAAQVERGAVLLLASRVALLLHLLPREADRFGLAGDGKLRREDVGPLFYLFLGEELDALGARHRLDDPGPGGFSWMPARVVARIAGHPWQGGAQQLRNAAREIAVAFHDAPEAGIPPAVERLFGARTEPIAQIHNPNG
ncbi:MAG TPA: hypothetical protein VJ725_08400 [Thermoanaerobaculia bacterium]|nr:hypothetical protein [Thermoanaerobaculia bacterium]